MTKKINIDTNFLDEDEKFINKPTGESLSIFLDTQSNHSNSNSSSNSLNIWNGWHKANWFIKLFWFIWRNFFWLFFWFIILVWVFSENNNLSSSSNITPNTNYSSNTDNSSSISSMDDNIETWQYLCAQYYHDEAWKLEPSSFDKSKIDSLAIEIEDMDKKIEDMKSNIDLYQIDNYSQSSIDWYNYKINKYNYYILDRQKKSSEYDNLLNIYNSAVDKYNNYLETNCTKRY